MENNTLDDNIQVDPNEQKIEKLLLEFDTHRDAINDMIKDLEKIRAKVDLLIPDQLDIRYIRLLEEKVKSITGLFNSLLEMRKEISKSVKDEIEIRRRIKVKGELENLEDLLDVRSMVNTIDQFKEDAKEMKKRRFKEQIKNMEDIKIPGLNSDEIGRTINE